MCYIGVNSEAQIGLELRLEKLYPVTTEFVPLVRPGLKHRSFVFALLLITDVREWEVSNVEDSSGLKIRYENAEVSEECKN